MNAQGFLGLCFDEYCLASYERFPIVKECVLSEHEEQQREEYLQMVCGSVGRANPLNLLKRDEDEAYHYGKAGMWKCK